MKDYRDNKNYQGNCNRCQNGIFDEDLNGLNAYIYPLTSGKVSVPEFFGKGFGRMMKTDVEENEKETVFSIEVPGIDKKDVEISVDDGYMVVSVKRESDENTSTGEGKNKMIRRERFVGSATRSYYVGDIEEDDIKAKMNNGILTVVVPKEEKKAPEKKHVTIE